jgi:hypothetical protein
MFITVPDEQVDLVLEQLDRPRAGAAGAEAQMSAKIIRKARDVGPVSRASALFDQKYAPALVAAIDDVERRLGVSPPRELRALRTLLRRAF